MDVRAAVAVAPGERLSLETVQLEGPKAGEVMVEIKATGVCHTDEFTLSGADPEGLFPAIMGNPAGSSAQIPMIRDALSANGNYEHSETLGKIFLRIKLKKKFMKNPSGY